MTFNIGDIVRIKSLGGVYSTYDKAIDHFSINKNVEINREFFNGNSTTWYKKLIIPENAMYENWVVVGKAIHGLSRSDDWIVYHIINCRGESLIMSEDSIILRRGVSTDTTKKLKQKYWNFKPLKIETHRYGE